MVVCKYCGREFEKNASYYAHKCEGYVKERQKIKRKKEEENNNGKFVCNGCGRHFATIGSLRSHARFCENYTPTKKYDENGKYISNSKYKIGDIYKCECGKEFDNYQSLNAHLSHCEIHHKCVGTERKLRANEIYHSMLWDNKTEKEIQEIHDKSGKTKSENLKSGKTKNHWLGKKQSDLAKQHHREAAIKLRKKLISGCAASYNKKSCEFIDILNEAKNWHLQHAENGGEVEVCGYFLDGYDAENNIAFEYDEPRHYSDVYNNVLKEKDIERQNYIIKNLQCEFYRYNEKLGYFYKI